MTATTEKQFVLVSEVQGEIARGTAEEVGSEILGHDGRSWGVEREDDRWIPYRRVGSRVEMLRWLAVDAAGEDEARRKVAEKACAAGNLGHSQRGLCVMDADGFDALESE